jgi:hypothetical protein
MSFGELIRHIGFNLRFVFNLQNSLTKYRANYFKVFSPKMNYKFWNQHQTIFIQEHIPTSPLATAASGVFVPAWAFPLGS